MKIILSAAITIFALTTPIFSQQKGVEIKSCEVSAYVMDKDPNGLNVRSTPDKAGKILTRLVKGGGEISLDIIGSAGNGWVKITNAWHGDTNEEYKVAGWVFATMLGTGTRGYPNYDSPAKLYSAASKKSKTVRTIPAEAEVIVQDCSGRWVKVSYEGVTGWLAPENQCGSPFTTCG